MVYHSFKLCRYAPPIHPLLFFLNNKMCFSCYGSLVPVIFRFIFNTQFKFFRFVEQTFFSFFFFFSPHLIFIPFLFLWFQFQILELPLRAFSRWAAAEATSKWTGRQCWQSDSSLCAADLHPSAHASSPSLAPLPPHMAALHWLWATGTRWLFGRFATPGKWWGSGWLGFSFSDPFSVFVCHYSLSSFQLRLWQTILEKRRLVCQNTSTILCFSVPLRWEHLLLILERRSWKEKSTEGLPLQMSPYLHAHLRELDFFPEWCHHGKTDGIHKTPHKWHTTEITRRGQAPLALGRECCDVPAVPVLISSQDRVPSICSHTSHPVAVWCGYCICFKAWYFFCFITFKL